MTTYTKSQSEDQETQEPVRVCKAGGDSKDRSDDQRKVEGHLAAVGVREHSPEHGAKHHAYEHGAREDADIPVLDLELVFFEDREIERAEECRDKWAVLVSAEKNRLAGKRDRGQGKRIEVICGAESWFVAKGGEKIKKRDNGPQTHLGLVGESARCTAGRPRGNVSMFAA